MGLMLSSHVALCHSSLLHPHVTVRSVQLDYKHGCVRVCNTSGAVGSLASSLEATSEVSAKLPRVSAPSPRQSAEPGTNFIRESIQFPHLLNRAYWRLLKMNNGSHSGVLHHTFCEGSSLCSIFSGRVSGLEGSTYLHVLVRVYICSHVASSMACIFSGLCKAETERRTSQALPAASARMMCLL